MSTLEDRRHDAELDARTPCPDCAADGFATSLAHCPGHITPLRPIMCDYHARIVEAASAATRPEKEALAAMADDFAHDCNHCEVH